MKKIISKIILLVLIINLFAVNALADDIQKQWVSLPTSVNQNGTTVSTNVFGYYTNIDNFGQVFIECDPGTGNETGNAYIPNVKIGSISVQKLQGYNQQKQLDLSTVKEVKPAQVQIIYPNVPADLHGDGNGNWEITPLTLPSSPTFGYVLQGNFPDYNLCVAQITNPNDFPVKATLAGYPTVYLGANETKIIKLNPNDFNSDSYLCYTLCTGLDPNNLPSDYPDFLKPMLFVPYTIDNYWGNTWIPCPTFPFGLCYCFYGYYSGPGAELEITGHVIYNFDTQKWSIYDSKAELATSNQADLLPYTNVDGELNAFDTWIVNKFNNEWGFYPPFINDYDQRIYDYNYTIGLTGLWADVYPGSTASNCGIGGEPAAWVPGGAYMHYVTDDPNNCYGSIDYTGDLSDPPKFIIDQPMNIAQYRFISSDGYTGYLQKYYVSGTFGLYESRFYYNEINGWCERLIYRQK